MNPPLETIRERTFRLSPPGVTMKCIHTLEGLSHGYHHDQADAKDQTEAEDQATADHLGGPRRALGADRAHPPGVLAQEADRAEGRQLAKGAQRHHLPDAQRLPVGPAPQQVRAQEHRPRLVPALVRRRRHGADLAGPHRGVRRTGRGGLAVAGRRRVPGQGPVRGEKRRARIPPTAGRKGPRRAC
jgi:hypothetical protein